MSLIGRIKQNQLGVIVTGFTGAAPQTVNATKVSMIGLNIEQGTLSATVYAKATVSTLTISAKWQVSFDGITWRDAYGSNRAANVAIATGTGSAVTDTVNIAAPSGVYGCQYARVSVVSGVGVGAGAGSDECSVVYNYRTISPFQG